MFSNHFRIARRAMARQKMYTAIKIGGFAVGLATCMLIAVFVRHELQYDTHYPENIFRLYNQQNKETLDKWTSFPAPIAQILRDEFPEIEKVGRLIPYNWYNAGSNLMRRDDQVENTFEQGFAYADPDLLSILQVKMVYGNVQHALAKPNTIVISRRKAEKYFPNEDPTGRVIIFNDDPNQAYAVGGVMENFPATSHLQFDFLLTLAGKEFWAGEQTSWCCWNYSPYVQVRPGTDLAALEKKMLSIRDTHYTAYLEKESAQSIEDVKKYHTFHLQPVRDIYLRSEGIHDNLSHGDMRYIWLFGGVAVFILLLACINFINLSTARSANRAREVGLRKVVGSHRSNLVWQFLTESVVYSFISFAFALLLVWIALPSFSTMAAKDLSMPWTDWWFAPGIVLGAGCVGVVAGIYPSFYLSAFRPAEVLKGRIALGSRSASLRSALVVFQFTTSIVLIIGTFVVYRQMQFILHSKVGFDKEQVLLVQGANTLREKYLTFKHELEAVPGVQGVTISSYLPVSGTTRDQNGFWREGKSKEENSVGMQKWYVDPDYISTLGMKLVEGRNFNIELASDSQAIIINQAAVKAFGFKKPVGERIMNWENYTVIGVIEDFNFESMKGAIGPLSLVMGEGGSIAAVKLTAGPTKATIEAISKVWARFLPHQPIRYTFLDERYARMYDDVQRMGYIFACFALLAVVVACLGLFALSTFMVEQRHKEISIRLVLGASINSIFRLLTQNFVKLVVVSFCLAAPLAWYLMQQWLEDYTYRVQVTWDVLALSGLLSIFIALFTISVQSLRAATANPVEGLRSE